MSLKFALKCTNNNKCEIQILSKNFNMRNKYAKKVSETIAMEQKESRENDIFRQFNTTENETNFMVIMIISY